MNDLERFLAIVNFEQPDYIPIFGFTGAPGMSGGCMRGTHERLVATGMPARIGGIYENWMCRDVESWQRYWGTTGFCFPGFGMARDVQGIRSSTRIEDGYEIVESECGSLIRQVIGKDITYSMPEFIRYSVRDRDSWIFWRDRMTPRGRMTDDELASRCRQYTDRDKPLCVWTQGPYGFLRGLMGPEALSYMFYDDPCLIADMMEWLTMQAREYTLPMIERLRPECVQMGEDLCYNHGMLLSPAMFDQYCGPHYRMIADAAQAAGVPVVAVDSDGNIMEFIDTASRYGLNCIYPCEVKAGNDLFALRRKHPRLICAGWLEKEIINEGNESMIEPEILRKVPPLLDQGGYFPNGDHGIQPLATFKGLCRFMTLLHEVCNNPEGEFPRVA